MFLNICMDHDSQLGAWEWDLERLLWNTHQLPFMDSSSNSESRDRSILILS